MLEDGELARLHRDDFVELVRPTLIPRISKSDLQRLDRQGQPQELTTDGLLAVCIQHEMDHLVGKLFVDYLSPLKREMVKKKLAKARKHAA